MSSLCDACKASGLPILPVRYTPVPSSVALTLPSWTHADRVANVPLGAEFHYALRTLRSGYVYLYFEKNARGSKKWECYAVTADGLLLKQVSPEMAVDPPPETVQCTSHGSSNVGLHYLVIEKPEKCGTTWIAFSEWMWSAETLKEYTSNKKLRDARMQTLHPSAMATGSKHSHGTPASVAAIEAVVEYAPTFDSHHLLHNQKCGPTSTGEFGAFDPAVLTQVSTRYPVSPRKAMAADALASMQKRAIKENGKHNTPHVLALWDAIGTTLELNGFRNDCAGRVDAFGHERQMQLEALNDINGVKAALQNRAATSQKSVQDEQLSHAAGWYDPKEDAQQRVDAQKLPEPQRSQRLQVLDIQRDWAMRQVPMMGFGARLWSANLSPEPARTSQINGLKAEVDRFTKERAKNYDGNIKRAIADAWPSYEERIDPAAWKELNAQFDKLNAQADAIIDRRTDALIKWLEAPLFIDTLEDFHPSNVNDGVLFDDVVGSAIMGIGTHKGGIDKIDAWVKEMKASSKSNLLWRAIALNQAEGINELDAALAEAKKHLGAKTVSSALTWVGYTSKSLKAFADTYKKAQGVFDGNAKASQKPAPELFGKAVVKPLNMRGADKLAITVGDRVFSFFRVDALGDYASEKIIQHVFSMRAYVNPLDSERLVAAQAEKELLSRRQILQRLYMTKNFLKIDAAGMREQQAAQLSEAWREFKAKDSKAPQAIKDARLAVVVALIEGVNFSKLMAECKTKGDLKSWLGLLASGMSISSAMFDIASAPLKNLPGYGSESWGYQALKGWGGVLSGGASFVGGFLDVLDAVKAHDKGYGMLSRYYVFKAIAGGTSGALTLGVALTYCGPLLRTLTGRVALGASMEAISDAAAAAIGLRLFGMALGGWITLGTFVVQVIIWQLTPDALQDWIDHSSLGKKRLTGGSKDAKQQGEKLEHALVEMGIS